MEWYPVNEGDTVWRWEESNGGDSGPPEDSRALHSHPHTDSPAGLDLPAADRWYTHASTVSWLSSIQILARIYEAPII